MPLPHFVPPITPSISSTPQREASVLELNFGDGYRQRVGTGINSVATKVRLVWDVLSADDAQALDDFFTSLAGVGAFIYTLPLESAPKVWSCKTWSSPYLGGTARRFEADLRQEFDPV